MRTSSAIGLHGASIAVAELSVFLDEFRHARRQAEHVLEHQDLPVALGRGADADGRDRDALGDPRGERLGQRLEHDGEGARLGDGLGIVLERRPFGAVAALRLEAAERVDRLRRQADMAHHRNAALG